MPTFSMPFPPPKSPLPAYRCFSPTRLVPQPSVQHPNLSSLLSLPFPLSFCVTARCNLVTLSARIVRTLHTGSKDPCPCVVDASRWLLRTRGSASAALLLRICSQILQKALHFRATLSFFRFSAFRKNTLVTQKHVLVSIAAEAARRRKLVLDTTPGGEAAGLPATTQPCW